MCYCTYSTVYSLFKSRTNWLDLLNIMHNVINVFGESHCFNWGRKTDDIFTVKTMKRPQMHFLANKPSNNNNLAQYFWEKIVQSQRFLQRAL